MQNNVQIYERRFNNIFDIISEIGGVIQFIFYFFYWINYVYNKYIIAYNTSKLFFSVRDSQSILRENRTNLFFNITRNIINLQSIRSISSKINVYNYKNIDNIKNEKANINKNNTFINKNNNQKINKSNNR